MHLTMAARCSTSNCIFNPLSQHPARTEHPASPQKISPAHLQLSFEMLLEWSAELLSLIGVNESKDKLPVLQTHHIPPNKPENYKPLWVKKETQETQHLKSQMKAPINRARILENNWETNKEQVKRENVTIYFLIMLTLAFCWLVLPFQHVTISSKSWRPPLRCWMLANKYFLSPAQGR